MGILILQRSLAISLLLISMLLIPTLAIADTHTAASCENKVGQLDVQAAVDLATAGDTVVIPAGTCTWDTKVTVTAAITITGQNNTSPTITAAANVSLFDIALNDAAGTFQLTKMALVGARTSASGEADVYLNGVWLKSRINDIAWSGVSPRQIWIGKNFFNDSDRFFGSLNITHQKVLIDNINFTATGNVKTQFLYIWGRNNLAWLEDDGYGTDNFIFLENSTLSWPDAEWPNYGVITDTEAGARFVLRYLDVTNGYVSEHDYANDRGNRCIEVYNNNLTATYANQTAFNMTRGGTGIAHNNVVSGFSNLNNPMIYRVFNNNAARFPGYLCSETDALKTCQDGRRHCVGGTKAGYVCYQDSHCTGGGTCNTSYACTSSDDCKDALGNTLACMQVDGDAENGYPCRDQAGRGKDNATTGVQESSPIYWYSNTVNTTPNTAYTVALYGAYITENVDYCNHDPSTDCGTKAAWAYTTYTCPHPLAGAGSCAAATAGRDGYRVGNSMSLGSGASMSIGGSGAVMTLQ
jgi:hypothetical protein